MDMQQLMRQAQQMQEQVAATQEAIAKEVVEASAGGGMVVVQSTGTGEIRSVKIDAEAVDTDDIELLEDMVLAAVSEAQRQAAELANQRMSTVMPGGMGGLGLPGM
ncbi:MAG: YbaB/EbfC family nucleoid-associated protein [Thermoleophilia bacterium]|nr:YbaB/EbfC family nucleoid-associated protein [Thermoleophilia bacterium]